MNSPAEESVDRVSDAFHSGAHVWVVSDVHGNDDALKAAFSLMNADEPLIVLGDLLTYGCQPGEVLERMGRELDNRPALLIWGNHDQMYRELAGGVTTYYNGIPPWIRESVDWTREHVGTDWLQWPWLESASFDEILFAHANPYPYGDWSYLNSYEDHLTALGTLRQNGNRLLLVGHTHRAKALLVQRTGDERWAESLFTDDLVVRDTDTAVVNTGSVGQPRNRERASTLVSLRVTTAGIAVKHHRLTYDPAGYLAAIRRSGMAAETRERLASFFVSEG